MLTPTLRAIKSFCFPSQMLLDYVFSGQILTLTLAPCGNQKIVADKALLFVKALLVMNGFDKQSLTNSFGPQHGADVYWNQATGEINVSVDLWNRDLCLYFKNLVTNIAEYHDWQILEDPVEEKRGAL